VSDLTQLSPEGICVLADCPVPAQALLRLPPGCKLVILARENARKLASQLPCVYLHWAFSYEMLYSTIMTHKLEVGKNKELHSYKEVLSSIPDVKKDLLLEKLDGLKKTLE
jgi:hypothetical protein